VTLLTDLADFVSSHRCHGNSDATEPAWNGYQRSKLPVRDGV